MNTFHCTHCQNQVFFENVECLHCGHALAYLPDQGLMAAVHPEADGLWTAEDSAGEPGSYRLCTNYTEQNVCNWAIPAAEEATLCQSCRLTRVIPRLSPAGREAWVKLETAKRRLMHNLFSLELAVHPKNEANDTGLAFEFLEDSTAPNGDHQRVLTGHDNGLITINIAEADDVQREQQRTRQHEPYRTVLGHLRHEIGHYFWDRLIAGTAREDSFRRIFGDERADYGEALKHHYSKGPPPRWEDRYVSAYATSHPWEDWAETWAHFLHMSDALETAAAAGLSLQPLRADEPVIPPVPATTSLLDLDFDQMIERWLPLAYVMNNLSRGLGHPDSYPFVLTPAIIEKLRFIHDTIQANRPAAEQRHREKRPQSGRWVRTFVTASTTALAMVGVATFVLELVRRNRQRQQI